MSQFRLGSEAMWQGRAMRLALARHDLRQVFKVMQRHGISQRMIAAATETNQSEVSEILTGQRIVLSYAVFVRVADGFGVPRGWLGVSHDEETLSLLAEPEKPVGRRPQMRQARRA